MEYDVVVYLEHGRWMPVEYISNRLQDALKITKQKSIELAEMVWKHGRATVKRADFETAEHYLELLENDCPTTIEKANE